MKTNPDREAQKSAVFVAMQLFSLVLLVLQLWLFVGVLESIIGRRYDMAVPAAIASIAILMVNLWILRGAYLLDNES